MIVDDSIDTLLRALADATRRSLLDRLRDAPGLTLGELAAGITVSRQALSKHLAVLQAAELVVPIWRGREKLHYLNPLPLQALPARWVTPGERGAALAALKRALEHPKQRSEDPIAQQLLADPGAAAGRVADAPALAAARVYLAGTADAVRRIIEALPATAGYRRPEGGGFSVAEHLWHLADVEELGWAVRLDRMWAEKNPRLPGVDGDRLAIERDYQHQPWRGAARLFIAKRRRSLRTLGHFGEATLARRVVFAGVKTTAADVLAAMVAHDVEHRGELAALLDKETER